MKKYFFTTLAVCFFLAASSAPVIKSIVSGNWNSTSIWDLNRLPKVGDTIIIPFGNTVTVSDDQNINGMAYLKIYGRLNFANNNSTLNLGSTSSVYVFPLAIISGGGTNSQKIRIGNTQVFKGDDVPILGPQVASSITNGFDPFIISNPLPVKFVGFTLTKSANNILVQWSTAEELNSHIYELERSADGSNWNTIAHIAATGTTQNLNHYSYNDKNIDAKIVYYRIKQVDQDGKFNYTSIKSIKNEIASAIAVGIASVQNQVLLQFSKEVKGNVIVRFVSLNGQVAEAHVVKNANGQIILRTEAKGNYYISVSNGHDLNIAKQILL